MKINVIGKGLYGEHVHRMLTDAYPHLSVSNFSVDDFPLSQGDIYILAVRPDKARELCTGILEPFTIIDLTPAHRESDIFQYVDVLFDGELHGNKFSMGGCMSSAIKCLFNHTGKLPDVHVEIGQSVTGRLSHKEDRQYGVSSQSREAGVEFSPILRHEKLSGISVRAPYTHPFKGECGEYIDDSVWSEYELDYNPHKDEITLTTDNFRLLDAPIRVVINHLISQT